MQRCPFCLKEEKRRREQRNDRSKIISRFGPGEKWHDRQAKCRVCLEVGIHARPKLETFAANFKGTTEELSSLDSEFLASALTHFLDKKHQENFFVVLSELKKRNWDPDSLDAEGLPMMVKATKAGCLEVVKLLVEQFNASIELYDGQNGNALICAVCERQFDIFWYLIDRFHAQIKEMDAQQLFNDQMEGRLPVSIAEVYNTTLLLLACKHSAPIEVIAKLLDLGANVNGRGYDADTPLMMASQANPMSLETIQLLVSRGANVKAVNDYSKSPLVIAIQANASSEVIKLLLGIGAYVDSDFESSGRVLEIACLNDAPFGVVKLLIQSASHKYLKTKKSSFCLVFEKCVENYSNEEVLEIVKMLLEKGVNVNSIYGLESVLEFACKSDVSADIVRLLLEAGAVIDRSPESKSTRDDHFETALHKACSSKTPSLDKIKLLIDSGADLNAKSPYGDTPLSLAIRQKASLEVLKLLIDSGADVNGKTDYKDTPLSLAISNKASLEVIKLLIDSGADNSSVPKVLKYEACISSLEYLKALRLPIDKLKEKKDVILHLCETGNLEIIKYLVEECGVDLSQQEEYGRSPVCRALESKTVTFDTIKYLVEHGAAITANCYANATVEMVKYFIEKGANVNLDAEEPVLSLFSSGSSRKRNQKFGKDSPLSLALSGHNKVNFEVIKLLVQKGAKVNVVCHYDEDESVLSTLCRHCPPPELVKLFIAAGADVNRKYGKSVPPLVNACKYKASPEVIKLLIQAGADVNSLGRDDISDYVEGSEKGSTALFWACWNWYPVETIKMIAERDADPARLPLDRIFYRQDAEQVVVALLSIRSSSIAHRLLVDACSAKAPVEFIQRIGTANSIDMPFRNLALVLACQHYDSLSAIKYLVAIGASVNARTEEERKTPLHMACSKFVSLDIIRFLIDSGADVNAIDDEGNTPFMLACNTVPVVTRELIDLFMNHNAAMNANKKRRSDFSVCYYSEERDEGTTAFLASCGKMSLEDTEYFISLGASVEFKSILAAACKNGASPEVIRYWLDKGQSASGHKYGEEGSVFTPLLHLCSNAASFEAVKLLLDAGAKVKADEDEPSPVKVLCKQKRLSFHVLKLLVDRGADVEKALDCLQEDQTRASIVFLRLRNAKSRYGNY